MNILHDDPTSKNILRARAHARTHLALTKKSFRVRFNRRFTTQRAQRLLSLHSIPFHFIPLYFIHGSPFSSILLQNKSETKSYKSAFATRNRYGIHSRIYTYQRLTNAFIHFAVLFVRSCSFFPHLFFLLCCSSLCLSSILVNGNAIVIHCNEASWCEFQT